MNWSRLKSVLAAAHWLTYAPGRNRAELNFIQNLITFNATNGMNENSHFKFREFVIQFSLILNNEVKKKGMNGIARRRVLGRRNFFNENIPRIPRPRYS